MINIFSQLLLTHCGFIFADNGNSTGTNLQIFERVTNGVLPVHGAVQHSLILVDMLQLQVDSLTQQVATMTESYQELIEDLRERNSNGLVFLPFETLHQKILIEGTFADGLFAQIIDHPNVTRLDKFILADVFISNADNDHFTLAFSNDIDCRTSTGSNFNGTNWGGPVSDVWDGKNQTAFVLFDASQENNSFPRWGQWT